MMLPPCLCDAACSKLDEVAQRCAPNAVNNAVLFSAASDALGRVFRLDCPRECSLRRLASFVTSTSLCCPIARAVLHSIADCRQLAPRAAVLAADALVVGGGVLSIVSDGLLGLSAYSDETPAWERTWSVLASLLDRVSVHPGDASAGPTTAAAYEHLLCKSVAAVVLAGSVLGDRLRVVELEDLLCRIASRGMAALFGAALVEAAAAWLLAPRPDPTATASRAAVRGSLTAGRDPDFRGSASELQALEDGVSPLNATSDQVLRIVALHCSGTGDAPPTPHPSVDSVALSRAAREGVVVALDALERASSCTPALVRMRALPKACCAFLSAAATVALREHRILSSAAAAQTSMCGSSEATALAMQLSAAQDDAASTQSVLPVSARLSALLSLLLGPAAAFDKVAVCMPDPLLSTSDASAIAMFQANTHDGNPAAGHHWWSLVMRQATLLQVPLPGGVAEGVIHYCIADLESPSPSPYSGTSLLSAAVAPLGELQGEQERQWRLFDRRTGVIAIARGWASPAFVQDLDTALQISVGRVLVLLLGAAPAAAFGPTCPLLLHIMAGVQARLDCPSPDIRASGLRIARAMGRRMTRGPPAPLAGPAKGADADGAAANHAQAQAKAKATLEAALRRAQGRAGGDGAAAALDPAALADVEAALAELKRLQGEGAGARASSGDDGGNGEAPPLPKLDPLSDDADASLEFAWEDLRDAYDVDLDDAGAAKRGVFEAIEDAATRAVQARLGPAAQSEGAATGQPGSLVLSQALPAPPRPLPIDASFSLSVAAYAAGRPFAVPPPPPPLPPPSAPASGPPPAPAASAARSGASFRDDGGGDARPVPESIRLARRLAARAPTTLSQVLPALREEADFEAPAAALPGLARLVRATALHPVRSHALLTEGPALARALLSLEDRFSLPGFHGLRFAALVSLVVCAAPLISLDLLTAAFCGDVSAGSRLEVVDALVVAVRELGGFGDAPVPVPPWEAELAEWDAAGPCPPAPGAAPAAPAASTAAAAPTAAMLGRVVAPVFFSPLLAAVLTGSPLASAAPAAPAGLGGGGRGSGVGVSLPADVLESLTGSGLSLGGLPPGGLLRPLLLDDAASPGDPVLMAQCLRALAVFLECARASADGPAMARALLPLTWALRRHRDLGLRRASLAAVAAVIAAVYRHRGEMLTAPAVLPNVEALGATGGGSGREAGASPPRALIREVSGSSAATPEPPEGARGESESSPLASLLSVGAHARAAEAAGFILAQAPAGSAAAFSGPLGGSRTNALLAVSAGLGAPASSARVDAGGGGPVLTMWDDLLGVTSFLRAAAESDPDDVCRRTAATMLANEVLQSLVLGGTVAADSS